MSKDTMLPREKRLIQNLIEEAEQLRRRVEQVLQNSRLIRVEAEGKRESLTAQVARPSVRVGH